MNIFLSLFLYILSVGLSSAYAGIGLDATRIIYNEGEKAVNVSVRNTDSKLNYLIQPSVSTNLDTPDNTTPFVFSP
ncbi:molecular chaperone, partial [Escherichia coli]|nr:molecular chaperone [Escherichia coli]